MRGQAVGAPRCCRGTRPAACCGRAPRPGSRRRPCRTASADRSRAPSPHAPSRSLDSTTVTGSVATSSVSSIACAAARSTSSAAARRRRTSRRPSMISLAHQLAQLGLALQHLLELVALARRAPPARRGSSSPRASRGGAAWSRGSPRPASSVSLKRSISTGFGSSSRADDADHLVEVEVGDQQAVEDVQPRVRPCSRRCASRRTTVSMRNASHSSSSALSPKTLRPAVEADDVEVDAVGALEVGGGEQVRHQLLDVDAVGARRDHQARRVLVVRLVAQVLHHRQLLGAHLRGDLLEHLRAARPGSGSAVMTTSPSSTS